MRYSEIVTEKAKRKRKKGKKARPQVVRYGYYWGGIPGDQSGTSEGGGDGGDGGGGI